MRHSSMPDATGEVVVISDATSSLGRALGLALARRGAQVVALAHMPAELAEDGLPSLVADVRDPASVAQVFDEIRAWFGAPTILINNAEIHPDRDILEETPDSFMDTLRINLGGAFNCCHAALPSMVAAGSGRIVNVVTFADIRPAPLSAGYSVSKGALRILTRALVADLGDRFPGIVVTDWIPGTHAPRRGVVDVIDPALAAEWGATLALMKSPELNGRLFLRDREHVPPQSLRGRVKDRVLGKGRRRVRLG